MPANVSQDPAAFRAYELARWQQVVDTYASAWGRLTTQAAMPLLDAAGVRSGAKVLDLATGPGYVANAAASQGADVIGIDFSADMVQTAQQSFPQIDFRVGDAQDLGFEADTFDAVTMSFGLMHLGEPEQAISEAFRVLKPGGRFGYTVWARPEQARGFSIILDAVKTHGRQTNIPHAPDFFHYSAPEVSHDSLRRAGFFEAHTEQVELTWRLASLDDVYPAFLYGTARTGGLIEAQDSDTRQAIEDQVRTSAKEFEATRGGGLAIPMPALLAWGVKS